MVDNVFPDPPSASASKADVRKQAKTLLLGALAGGVIGIAFVLAFAVMKPGVAKGGFGLNALAMLAFPLVWLLVVFVHELGHLVAGWLAGMRPVALYAGPFHFDFSGEGLRLRVHRAMALIGGLTICLPAPGTTPRHFALLVAGGPFASLVLAVAAGAALAVLSGTLAGIAFLVAMLSGLVTLATLVPMRSAGYLTDGAQLLGIARDDPTVHRRLLLAAMIAQSYGGTRPRDLDVTVLDRVRGSGEPAIDASVSAYEAAIALDRGELAHARRAYTELAEALLDTPTERLPIAARRAMALPIASWLGQFERDAQRARAWLEYSRGGFGDAAAIAHAEAAVASAEGSREESLRRIHAARAALPRCADRGGAAMLRERIDALEAGLPATPA